MKKCLIHPAYSKQCSRPPSVRAKPPLSITAALTSNPRWPYIHNSAGFSLNIPSRFNACEMLYWHGRDVVIYARRQFCKYLGIFAFIIRDIHFLVPLSVHFFFLRPVVCAALLMQLSLSGSEDKRALSCVLLEVKTSEAASQVPEARAGVCCVCCVRSVMRTECQLLLLINFSSSFLQMWKF